MRLIISVVVCIGVLATLGLGSPDPAAASGCPSKQQVLPSNAAQADDGYMCAQDNVSGKMSIGAWATHSWTVDTNADYLPHYMCHDQSSGGFTMSELAFAGSGTITATNWNTGTRHWAGLILWTPMSYAVNYKSGCSVTDQVWNSPPNYLGISTITLEEIAIGGTTYWQEGQTKENFVVACGVPVSFSVQLNHASEVQGEEVILANGFDSSNAPIVVAGGKIASDGSATLTWYPNATTNDLTIIYPGNSGETPAEYDLVDFTVNPTSVGRCVDITAVSAVAGTTAEATVSVAPTDANTIVALVNAADGDAVLGEGVARSGSGTATIRFTFDPGVLYTFVAVAVDSDKVELGQSDPFPNPAASQWQSGALPPAPNPVSYTPFSFIPAKPWPTPDPATIAKNVRTLVTRAQTVRADIAQLRVACPSGTRLLYADGMTTGPIDDIVTARLTQRSLTLQPRAHHVGYKVLGQILCRATNASPTTLGTTWFGNHRANRVTTRSLRSLVYAGAGRDVVRSTGKFSTVHGGLGDDVIKVAGKRSVADGGPGDDRIIAQGKAAALLVGGPGTDGLVGSYGKTTINAVDGSGGDTIVCRSSQTRVAADVGDTLIGPCQVLALYSGVEPVTG